MALPAGWVLFLTSKVRLHCDPVRPRYCHVSPGCGAFPDLKGQAPLRRELGEVARVFVLGLFLTSKVRLHCDCRESAAAGQAFGLFLTSKVRLHCDIFMGILLGMLVMGFS